MLVIKFRLGCISPHDFTALLCHFEPLAIRANVAIGPSNRGISFL